MVSTRYLVNTIDGDGLRIVANIEQPREEHIIRDTLVTTLILSYGAVDTIVIRRQGYLNGFCH